MAFTDWTPELMETEIDENVEETVEEVVEEQETTEEVETQHNEETTETEQPSEPQKFNINGQELTLEEIKTGYMRQQDYITQREELNKLREESKQALDLVDYLKKNPNLAQKLMEEPEA